MIYLGHRTLYLYEIFAILGRGGAICLGYSDCFYNCFNDIIYCNFILFVKQIYFKNK